MAVLLELEKPKYTVDEGPFTKGNDASCPDANSKKLAVVLPFTIVDDPVTALTELGISVKTKLIVIAGEIVLLHVLLLYALFDITTEFEATL